MERRLTEISSLSPGSDLLLGLLHVNLYKFRSNKDYMKFVVSQQDMIYFLDSCMLTVPEFIDPVFAKTSLKRSFSVSESERFRLVSAKTGSINSGTALW